MQNNKEKKMVTTLSVYLVLFKTKYKTYVTSFLIQFVIFMEYNMEKKQTQTKNTQNVQ